MSVIFIFLMLYNKFDINILCLCFYIYSKIKSEIFLFKLYLNIKKTTVKNFLYTKSYVNMIKYV